MMAQSNMDRILRFDRILSNLADRLERLSRDDIMEQYHHGEISAQQAVELMQEADR